MSAAWNGGLTRTTTTADGQSVTVVYRGHWSHGFGPDFSDAVIQFGEADLRTGDVELHRASSDWYGHGHHLDQRYNAVVLHVVSKIDVAETRREDGSLIPMVVLDIPDADLFAIDQELPDIWSRLGKSTCAEELAGREPDRLRKAIMRLGDLRFTERVARFEGELAVDTVPAVMIRGLFDAFGYSQNREPMQLLANRVMETGVLTARNISPARYRLNVLAALYGFGGFLPMAPSDAHLASLSPEQVSDIEEVWGAIARDIGPSVLAATIWTRARTRPSNHPAARLVSLGNLLAATSGDPTAVLVDAIRSGPDITTVLRELSATANSPGIGEARAVSIVASVVLPVMMALAHHADDVQLEDAVARAWAELPRSEWSRPARRALAQAVGEARLGPMNERAIQGLLHLDRALCTPRRCFECPIAAEVIRDIQRKRSAGPAVIQSILPT